MKQTHNTIPPSGVKGLQKVFAILVALEGNQFEYYLAEPKIFYDIRAEAQYVVDQVIQSKKFNKQQLKIATLWKITPSNS